MLLKSMAWITSSTMRQVIFHNEKLCCVAPPLHSTSWKADFTREIDAFRSLASRFAKPGAPARNGRWHIIRALSPPQDGQGADVLARVTP